jgi:hypothetical protein
MFGIGTWLWYKLATWLSKEHSCICLVYDMVVVIHMFEMVVHG